MLDDNYEQTEDVEKIIMNIEPKAEIQPEGVKYNGELLNRKISSIRSYMTHMEYQKILNQLNEARKKNSDYDVKINELKMVAKKAKKRKGEINQLLKELREEEFKQVGPYLYKIFRKLSRNIKIDGLNLLSGKGNDQLSLTDESGKSILNMFSDGQLSVFMLSYFFGNALRIKDDESLTVYFIDDITSCMDDINMLAFLDFIKYQLSGEDGAFEQLFFATCDANIQDMFCWKMDSCGIEYKKIEANELEKSW